MYSHENVEKQRTGGCSLRCKSRSKYSRQLTRDGCRHWLYFVIGPILTHTHLLSHERAHTSSYTHVRAHTHTYASARAHSHTHLQTHRVICTTEPLSCLGSLTDRARSTSCRFLNVPMSPTTLMEIVCVMFYRSGKRNT